MAGLQRSSSSPDLTTHSLESPNGGNAAPSGTTYAMSTAITSVRRRSRAVARAPPRSHARASHRSTARAEARSSCRLGGVIGIGHGDAADGGGDDPGAVSSWQQQHGAVGGRLRRLFNLRRHVESVLTRSESSAGNQQQLLPAVSAMHHSRSSTRRAHRSTAQSQPEVETKLDMYDHGHNRGDEKPEAQLFGHLTLDVDTDTTPGGSSPSIIAPASVETHLNFARRRHKLKCLEFDTEGNFVERTFTRQEILNEARGAMHPGHTLAAAKKRGQQQRTQTAFSSANDRDKFSERRTRNLRNKTLGRSTGGPASIANAMQRAQSKAARDPDRSALTMRDIRQVDPAFTPKAALWVRQNALVVSLESVRAIILHNKVFLFDPDNAEVQRPIRYIKQRLSDGIHNIEEAFMPFEFRALEGILIHSCIRLEKEFAGIEPTLLKTLGQLPMQINAEHLEYLRRDEQRLVHFYSRSRKVQNVLQSVLDEDEDMAGMYLTEKHKTPEVVRNDVDHDEAEMLIESYLQVVDDLTNKAGLLNTAIDDTENLIEIHLDTMQNQLLLVNLLISAITTIFTLGTAVTAIFGMNLPLPVGMSELPTSQYYFYGCVSLTLIVMATMAILLIKWSQSEGIYARRHVVRRRKNKNKRVDDEQPVIAAIERTLEQLKGGPDASSAAVSLAANSHKNFDEV
jgi:magnesium transporter